MGGPPIDPDMVDLIHNTWLELRQKQGSAPTAKEVRSAVLKQLRPKGYTETDLPSKRSFENKCKEAREKYKDGLTPIQSGNAVTINQEQPWNMSTLDSFELPPESIPFVLQVWRYSLAVDEELTIRQAKWASRLCFQLKDKDIAEFWNTSISYAREEQLSLLSGSPMRIYLLDSLLVADNWERRTLEGTDIIIRPIFYIRHSYLRIGHDGGIQEEFFHALPRIDPSTFEECSDENYFDRTFELHMLVDELPSSSKYFPDIQTRLIYLRHLSYMSKMPKWDILKPDEIRDIIVDLRQWVINESQKLNPEYNAPPESDTSSPIPPELAKWKADVERLSPGTIEFFSSFLRHTPFPIEIYERAGYTPGYCQKKGGNKDEGHNHPPVR